MVAIKIWHEMAHIAGADELDARRQEEKEFIVSQKVDVRRGVAYLDLLRKRRLPGDAAASAGGRTPPRNPTPPE